MTKLNGNMKNQYINKYLAILFFILALIERVFFDLGPNVELLTAAIIVSAFYLKDSKTFLYTLLVLIISDSIIKNTPIFIFTWSGLLIPALVGVLTNKKLKLVFLAFAGVSANIFFFLWTNFGVWLLDSWGMYPKTVSGLFLCYFNGLPFLKNQLISSIVFIPLFWGLINFSTLLQLLYNRRFSIRSFTQ